MFFFFFFVDRVCLSGDLAIFWNNGNAVSLLGYFVGHIDVPISVVNSFSFYEIYGNLKPKLRKHSWDLLKRLRCV